MAGYMPTRDLTHAERDEMDRLTSGLPTKAAKVRALSAAGYSRSTTAAYLGISYQHVRSVLTTHAPTKAADVRHDAETEREWGAVRVAADGSIVLPPAVMKALAVEPGLGIGWRIEHDSVVLMGPKSGLRFLHELAPRYAADNDELASEQIIKERREEAAREELKNP